MTVKIVVPVSRKSLFDVFMLLPRMLRVSIAPANRAGKGTAACLPKD
jgi:hypothetical protein